ncbi:MAG: GntR family transcriptional regulator [Planctomycetota bacterium]|nr:GntR family transcriptional regulator [Planctomycetota bacterium]
MASVMKRTKARSCTRLCMDLREQIRSGEISPADFLPSVRQIGEKYGVTPKTAYKALKILESEGLISGAPRRGYRVRPGAGDPNRGCPVAFVDWREGEGRQWGEDSREYLFSLQECLLKRGWPLLAIGAKDEDPDGLMRRLKAARVCGIIVSEARDLADIAVREGMPTVAIDWWEEDLNFDAVLQDDFQGGALAARYLIDRGHRRIAWFGHTTATHHSRARLGGATMELMRAGIAIPPDLCVRCSGLDVEEAAAAVLSRPDRPGGVLALWMNVAIGVFRVARRLGLQPGRDFEMVGWARGEEYRHSYVPAFAGGPVPPAVVWSPAKMMELAVERLAARLRSPELPVVKINVPVSLAIRNEGGGSQR